MDFFPRTRPRNNEFAWTRGANNTIVHQRPIGSGGYGQVHEMRRIKGTKEVFARKIVRLSGRVEEADIQNELRAVSAIRKSGGHQNIIHILDYGALRGELNVYYIDMELGDFTLMDYIVYHRDNAHSSARTEIRTLVTRDYPRLIDSDSRKRDVNLLLANICAIGEDLAEGLAFMHSQKLVHRDLKPSNVLYCASSRIWKLADFGITSLATTRHAVTTKLGIGTGSYIAPEILNGKFSNKADIWSFGCVFYELLALKLAFTTEWEVRTYDESKDVTLKIPILNASPFLQNNLAELVQHLLHRLPEQRPRASTVLKVLFSVSTLLDFEEQFSSVRSVFSYSEWLDICNCATISNSDSKIWPVEAWLRLAKSFHQSGELQLAMFILAKQVVPLCLNERMLGSNLHDTEDEAVKNQQLVLALARAQVETHKDYRMAIELCLFAINYCETPANRPTSPLWQILGDFCLQSGGTEMALSEYKKIIERDPESTLWQWHCICGRQLSAKDIPQAIDVLRAKSNATTPVHPEALILLANLYAQAGRFDDAITTQMKMFQREKTIQRLFDMSINFLVQVEHSYKYNSDMTDGFRVEKIIFEGWQQGPHGLKAILSSIACLTAPIDRIRDLSFAAWTGNLALIKRLAPKPRGFTSSYLVIEGYTPLELAAWNMHFEAVKLLLDSAAEFTVLRDPIRRTTPLHFAAGNDDIRTLQLLLAYDFDVDSRDQRGQTPLHWAAARGHSECVIMLLEAGANMSLLSNEGLTPLVTALRQNHAYTVKILEDWTQTGQIRIQSEPERAIYDSQETLEYYPQELSIELREILKYEPQEVNINPHTRQPWPNNQFLHPNMHTHRQASASQIQ